jgi:hypothetical protein
VLRFQAGGNCSSERRFGGSVSLRDAEVKRKIEVCRTLHAYMCIGAGSKIALSRLQRTSHGYDSKLLEPFRVWTYMLTTTLRGMLDRPFWDSSRKIAIALTQILANKRRKLATSPVL